MPPAVARTIRRMSGDATTWYELLPDGHAEDGAERYAERAAAEQAATAMLIRRPELVCVDVAECRRRLGAEHRRADLGERSRRRRARPRWTGSICCRAASPRADLTECAAGARSRPFERVALVSAKWHSPRVSFGRSNASSQPVRRGRGAYPAP